MFIKNFLSEHGVPIVLFYIGAFALLISLSRTVGINTGLPGDILLKSQETGQTNFFLPITSSAIVSLAAYITYRIFILFNKG